MAVPGYPGPAADRAQREPRPQRQGTPLQILGRVPGPFPEAVAVKSPAALPPFLRSTWPRRTPDGSEHRLNSPPHMPAHSARRGPQPLVPAQHNPTPGWALPILCGWGLATLLWGSANCDLRGPPSRSPASSADPPRVLGQKAAPP